MSELARFVLAQIEADEEAARAATEASDRFWMLMVDSQGDWICDFDNGTPLVCGYGVPGDRWGKDRDSAVLAHIARHDPARVLAECASKKAIVAANIRLGDYDDEHPTLTLRLLAQPFAGREGWRDEWDTNTQEGTSMSPMFVSPEEHERDKDALRALAAQRFVRQINEGVERMRADMQELGSRITRMFAEATDAARRDTDGRESREAGA